MTTAQAAMLIGREGLLPLSNGMQVTVRVLDIKQAYGRTRYVVEPVRGTGQATVESLRFPQASFTNLARSGRTCVTVPRPLKAHTSGIRGMPR